MGKKSRGDGAESRIDPAIAIQAFLIERDLRALLASIDDRLGLAKDAGEAELGPLRAARSSADRALSLVERVIATVANHEGG
jgi:hypothetical protein